jgi:hypothetical protein
VLARDEMQGAGRRGMRCWRWHGSSVCTRPAARHLDASPYAKKIVSFVSDDIDVSVMD